MALGDSRGHSLPGVRPKLLDHRNRASRRGWGDRRPPVRRRMTVRPGQIPPLSSQGKRQCRSYAERSASSTILREQVRGTQMSASQPGAEQEEVVQLFACHPEGLGNRSNPATVRAELRNIVCHLLDQTVSDCQHSTVSELRASNA